MLTSRVLTSNHKHIHHMKQSKEQPPQQEHTVHGVYIHLSPHQATIKPCPQRKQRIITTTQTALEQQTLTPSLAQKLAGKCSFTTTQLFGRVGRAANRALYDHAFSHQPTMSHLLDMNSWRCSTSCDMQHLAPVPYNHPRPFPPSSTQTHSTPSTANANDVPKAHKDLSNGWGIVIFPARETPIVTSGHIPPTLLQFTSSHAFIYFLEAWTAIIAPVVFRPLLTTPYIQVCDNEASKHAILKGTGKHQPLNNLIGSHWTWHNRCQLHQILDRVPTTQSFAPKNFQNHRRYHLRP